MSTPNISLNRRITPSPPAHKIESPMGELSQVKHPRENSPIFTIGSSSGLNNLISLVTPPPARIYSLPVSVWVKNFAQNILQCSLSLKIPVPFQSIV